MDKNKEKEILMLIEELDILSKIEDKQPNDIIRMAEIYLLTHEPTKALNILKDYIEEFKDNKYYNKIMSETLIVLKNPVAGFRFYIKSIGELKDEKEKEECLKDLYSIGQKITLPFDVVSYKERVVKAIYGFGKNIDEFRQYVLLKENSKAKEYVLKYFNEVIDIEFFEFGYEKEDLYLRFSPLGKQYQYFKLLYIYQMMPQIDNFKFYIVLDRQNFDDLEVNDQKFYLTELKYKIEEVNKLLILKVYDPFKKNNPVLVSRAFSDYVLANFFSEIIYLEKEEDGMVLRDELEQDLIQIVNKETFDKASSSFASLLQINKQFGFNEKYDIWKPRLDIRTTNTNFDQAIIYFIKDNDMIFENYFLNGIILGSIIIDAKKELTTELNPLFNELVEKDIVINTGVSRGNYYYFDFIIFNFKEFFEVVDKFFNENEFDSILSANYCPLYGQVMAKQIKNYAEKEKKVKKEK